MGFPSLAAILGAARRGSRAARTSALHTRRVVLLCKCMAGLMLVAPSTVDATGASPIACWCNHPCIMLVQPPMHHASQKMLKRDEGPSWSRHRRACCIALAPPPPRSDQQRRRLLAAGTACLQALQHTHTQDAHALIGSRRSWLQFARAASASAPLRNYLETRGRNSANCTLVASLAGRGTHGVPIMAREHDVHPLFTTAKMHGVCMGENHWCSAAPGPMHATGRGLRLRVAAVLGSRCGGLAPAAQELLVVHGGPAWATHP